MLIQVHKDQNIAKLSSDLDWYNRVHQSRYLILDAGIQSIRQSVSGGPLPSARTVSANILHFEHVFEPGYTAIISHFGQFLDHDLSSSGADSSKYVTTNY